MDTPRDEDRARPRLEKAAPPIVHATGCDRNASPSSGPAIPRVTQINSWAAFEAARNGANEQLGGRHIDHSMGTPREMGPMDTMTAAEVAVAIEVSFRRGVDHCINMLLAHKKSLKADDQSFAFSPDQMTRNIKAWRYEITNGNKQPPIFNRFFCPPDWKRLFDLSDDRTDLAPFSVRRNHVVLRSTT